MKKHFFSEIVTNFLLGFIGITSVIGGLLLVYNPHGGIFNLQLPMLKNTPFNSFVIPGIILGVVVGGINLYALYLNIQQRGQRLNWAIAGGCAIAGWIAVQVILIQTINNLHITYFCAGILLILAAYQAKGRWAV